MKELRHHIQLLFCLCLWMALPFTQVRGQNTSNEFVEEMHLLEIENRMLNFYQELKNISASCMFLILLLMNCILSSRPKVAARILFLPDTLGMENLQLRWNCTRS